MLMLSQPRVRRVKSLGLGDDASLAGFKAQSPLEIHMDPVN